MIKAISLFTIISYLFLAISVLKIDLFNLIYFVLWILLLVLPIGKLCLLPFGWNKCDHDFSEDCILSIVFGLIALSFVTVILSLILKNAMYLGVILFLLIPFLWILLGKTSLNVYQKSSLDHGLIVIVFTAAIVHLSLLPNYFSGIDATGIFFGNGIGEDGYYLSLVQQITDRGTIIENPFYAGHPFIKHHLFAQFLVSSYSMTFGKNIDIFQTRLLFHFILATPLFLSLIYVTLKRLKVSLFVTICLLLSLILPTTYYPQYSGWSGLIGSSAFWIAGIHADLSYSFGLIMFIFTTLIVIKYLDDKPYCFKSLLFIQGIFALSTQFKVNFSLAYYPAAQLVFLYYFISNKQYKLAAASILSALIFDGLIYGILGIITDVGFSREFGIEYGTVALETFLPILNPHSDILSPLLGLLSVLPGIFKPLGVIVAYSFAYTPFFLFVVPYIITLCKNRGIFDLYLVVTFITALMMVLFAIEKTSSGKWNLSGHLHYLIPIIAIYSAARVSTYKVKSVRLLNNAILLVLITNIMFGMYAGSKQFKFLGDPPICHDKDFVSLCGKIAKETPNNAIIVVNNKDIGICAKYVLLFTRRTYLLSKNFVYYKIYKDFTDRERIIEFIASRWPNIDNNDIVLKDETIKDRKLIVIGRLDKKNESLRSVTGLTCVGSYCFKQLSPKFQKKI